MPRFYCPQWPVSDTTTLGAKLPRGDTRFLSGVVVALDADQAHHAQRVLRLQPGDVVEVFDGRGTVGSGQLELSSGRVSARITQAKRVVPPQPTIDIAAAAPKGPRAGDMVNQLSQLGATKYLPLRTSRSVAHPGPGRLQQLARVAIESAKQCARAHLMAIDPLTTLNAVLLDAIDQYDLRLIATAPSTPDSDPPAAMPPGFDDRLNSAKRILVLIGPEGGWTDQERQAAQQARCVPWSLGPHVLRVETAAAAAVGVLRYLATHGD